MVQLYGNEVFKTASVKERAEADRQRSNKVTWGPIGVVPVLSVLPAPKQDTVGPGGDALFVSRVVVIGEQVILIGRGEVDLPLDETLKALPLFIAHL